MIALIRILGIVLVLGTFTFAFAQARIGGPRIQSVYSIGGRVVDSSGKPACNVRLCAYPDDFDARNPNVTVQCAFSNKDGFFSIAVVKTGTYRIIYDGTDQGYWSPYLPFFRSPTSTIPEVVVDNSTPRGQLEISLMAKNGMLVGKSIDVKTGLPVENVEFVLCHAANPQTCRTVVVKNAEGNFRVPAPHVPFTLTAKALGFEDWTGLSGAEKTPISVPEGSSLDLNLLLKRQSTANDRAISEVEKQGGVYLPAPVQQSPSDGVVFDHFPRATKLEWAPVENAVSYSIEIDYCQGGRRECLSPNPLMLPANPPQSGIKGTTYEFNFVGAQPGRWRVWAVDQDGREGFKSPWRTFIYLQ